MVTLSVSKAKKPFFQDRIFSIPKGRCNTQYLMLVTKSCYTLLTPTICIASGQIMGDKIPCASIQTIIFPNRSPLPVRHIRTPFLPSSIVRRFQQPRFFFSHVQSLLFFHKQPFQIYLLSTCPTDFKLAQKRLMCCLQ